MIVWSQLEMKRKEGKKKREKDKKKRIGREDKREGGGWRNKPKKSSGFELNQDDFFMRVTFTLYFSVLERNQKEGDASERKRTKNGLKKEGGKLLNYFFCVLNIFNYHQHPVIWEENNPKYKYSNNSLIKQ